MINRADCTIDRVQVNCGEIVMELWRKYGEIVELLIFIKFGMIFAETVGQGN